jgi:predicted nucleic acid-binding protein
MKKLRIYLDTSVIGGVFDEEFMERTKKLFAEIKEGRYIPCTSVIVSSEIEKAPDFVISFFNELLPACEVLEIDSNCLSLRDEYLKNNIVSRKYMDDALHVAIATVSNCDIIVSWNFKHIVHFDKIALYNAVNRINGYKDIFINSPAEVIDYEE